MYSDRINFSMIRYLEDLRFGLFSAEGDLDVDQKAQALAARIGDNCLRLFGFRAVVKVKRVGGGD